VRTWQRSPPANSGRCRCPSSPQAGSPSSVQVPAWSNEPCDYSQHVLVHPAPPPPSTTVAEGAPEAARRPVLTSMKRAACCSSPVPQVPRFVTRAPVSRSRLPTAFPHASPISLKAEAPGVSALAHQQHHHIAFPRQPEARLLWRRWRCTEIRPAKSCGRAIFIAPGYRVAR